MSKDKKYYIFEMKMGILNILSIFLLAFVCLIAYLINSELFINSVSTLFNFEINCLINFLILFLYLAFHEVLHGLSYRIHGGKKDKIIFGAELEKGVFYCLCKQNVSKKNILNSLMYPLFYIGIVTFIISLIFEMELLLILSIFNIAGCIGDIVMFIYISKLRNIEFSEMDDPTSFAIYADYDVSKVNHFGLEYKGKKEEIVRKDFTKIKVSKLSKIFILVFLLLLFIIGLIEILL